MKIVYEQHNFRRKTLKIIEAANEILAEYSAQGLVLTVRQLFYQFVARDLLSNTKHSYDLVDRTINLGRMAGLIDWRMLEDRTRGEHALSHWESVGDILTDCVSDFHVDIWRTQPRHVEVWIEKDALIGVIEGVCQKLDMTYFACKGYASVSAMWEAGQRLKEHIRAGQSVTILYFGDHDPSGIDMDRDIEKRLRVFIEHDFGPIGDMLEVRRLALTLDQVQRYGPPPNPVKEKSSDPDKKGGDNRAKKYVEEFGKECWELDALPPEVIVDLIEAEVLALRDDDAWQAALDRQEAGRERLRAIADAEAQ